MKEQIKFVLALGAVLLLLPCVLTVFLSGRGAVSFFGEEDLEGYVAAGTCLALPFSGTEEMRKAQAVLIRSQFCTQTEAERQTRIEEITEQVLKARKQPDFEKMYRLARKAASDTKGEVLYWKGEVCSGAFHPVSAGKTRDGREVLQKEEYGYLKSVESPGDVQSPDYLSGKSFTPEELTERLSGLLPGITVTAEDLPKITAAKTDSAGYVLELQIGDQILPGETAAEALELPSCCFTVQVLEGRIRFLCQGVGHGMGMSQYGAEQMALAGEDYREILAAYFPETEIRMDGGV